MQILTHPLSVICGPVSGPAPRWAVELYSALPQRLLKDRASASLGDSHDIPSSVSAMPQAVGASAPSENVAGKHIYP